MINNRNKIIFSILAIGVLIVGLGIFNKVEAVDPSLYVFPVRADMETGDTLLVSVMVNPNGEKVCVVEGILNLNNLSCKNITVANNISVQTMPSCDNLSFMLGIQGCTTNTKMLFTIEVEAGNADIGEVSFTNIDLIGRGVSLSSNSTRGSYNISSTAVCNCSDWGEWQDIACGDGGCSSDQMLQTRSRTCVLNECGISENQCVEDSTCMPEEEIGFSKKDNMQILASGLVYQDKLFAMAMEGVAESMPITILIILCLAGLVIIGGKECSLFLAKKRAKKIQSN